MGALTCPNERWSCRGDAGVGAAGAPAGSALGAGDVGVSVEAMEVERGVAEHGHHLRSGAGADARDVFTLVTSRMWCTRFSMPQWPWIQQASSCGSAWR